jgi:hypothetical protein
VGHRDIEVLGGAPAAASMKGLRRLRRRSPSTRAVAAAVVAMMGSQ